MLETTKSNYKESKLFLLCISLFYFFVFFIAPERGFQGDIHCWDEWTKDIFRNGIGNVYKSEANYSPLTLYILDLFGLIQGSEENIHNHIRYLKEIFLLFDVAGVLILACVLKKINSNIWLSMFLLLNVAYLYNTLIWGQVDSMYVFLGVASLFLAMEKKTMWSTVFLFLAINTKLQAVIFIPVTGLILIPQFAEKKRKIIYALLCIIVIQFALLFPFIISGQTMQALTIYMKQIGRYPNVSSNACNLWAIIFHDKDLSSISDATLFVGLSYKSWGFVLFILSSLFALWPMLYPFIKAKKVFDFSIENIRLASLCTLLLAMNFYFFNTQMHERYIHPAIILSGIYCILEGQYILYAVLSVAYFLNLERVMRFLELGNYSTTIMHPTFIAGLFACCMLYGYYKLYSRFPVRKAAA